MKDLKFDPVIQLITGKFEKIRVGSNLKEVFVPHKRNPNPPITEILKGNKDLSREQVLVKERLVQPRFFIDREVFVKTESEKDMLKTRKSLHKKSKAA